MRYAPAATALALAAACTPAVAPAPKPAAPAASPSQSQRNAEELGLAGGDDTPSGPTQDEILAAIQKAMTELDPIAHACWASAAAIRFDIEGDLELRITPTPANGSASADVGIVGDTTRNKTLVDCMLGVLAKYPWAPPLHGQTFQLPFRFRAPDGQNVIDRRDVPAAAQAGVSVAVLLDANNSGDEAASMFEVGVAQGASTGDRVADRAELWYFVTPAHVAGASVDADVAAGDMVYVPAGGARTVSAPAGDVRAMLAVVPGGREGVARAGALPTREVGAVRSALAAPVVLRAAAAKAYGPATIYLDPAVVKTAPFSAELLSLAPGASIAEHVHAKETELLYVLDGSGTLTVNGDALPVTPTTVTQIPAGAKHAFTVAPGAAFRAVQLYTPGGPEQRFKK